MMRNCLFDWNFVLVSTMFMLYFNCRNMTPGNPVALVKMRNGVSYLVYMYTLGAGRILIKSNIIVCLLNLMAWKASWAHRTGENENEKR